MYTASEQNTFVLSISFLYFSFFYMKMCVPTLEQINVLASLFCSWQSSLMLLLYNSSACCTMPLCFCYQDYFSSFCYGIAFERSKKKKHYVWWSQLKCLHSFIGNNRKKNEKNKKNNTQQRKEIQSGRLIKNGRCVHISLSQRIDATMACWSFKTIGQIRMNETANQSKWRKKNDLFWTRAIRAVNVRAVFLFNFIHWHFVWVDNFIKLGFLVEWNRFVHNRLRCVSVFLCFSLCYIYIFYDLTKSVWVKCIAGLRLNPNESERWIIK